MPFRMDMRFILLYRRGFTVADEQPLPVMGMPEFEPTTLTG